MKYKVRTLIAASLLCSFSAAVPLMAWAGEIKDAAPMGSLETLIDLLRDRGIMTAQEASELQRRLAVEKAPPAEDAPLAKKVLPPPAEQLPDEDLKALVEVMREQGVVSAEEAQALVLRFAKPAVDEEPGDTAAKPAAATTSPVPVIVEGKEIPYVRSSMEQEEVRGLIKTAREQRVVSPEEADLLEERYAAKTKLDQVAVSVGNDVRQEMKEQVKLAAKDELKAESKSIAAPDWTKRIKFSGDLRLRYQSEYFGKDNVEDILYPNNQRYKTDRQRMRLRARLGVNGKILDELEAGIRLATGTTSDPVSTNTTLGDTFNKKNFLLDQAYLKWTPLDGNHAVTAWGGRIPNPWLSTDLVWDNDLNFEGIAVNYAPRITNTIGLFFTGGLFPLQDIEISSSDKWLFGGQAGVTYRNEELSGKLAVALYDYRNITAKMNRFENVAENDHTLPQFVQKGNTMYDINPRLGAATHTEKLGLAARYRELNLTGSLDLGYWHPVHLVLMGDYVNNIGYDSAEVDSLVGTRVKKETEGFQFGLALGHTSLAEFGDWKGFLAYRYLEADAVLDAFTDSDFHLGGTNAKGWILGGEVGLAKNVSLSGKWMTANEITADRLPETTMRDRLAIDVFQLDLNARF